MLATGPTACALAKVLVARTLAGGAGVNAVNLVGLVLAAGLAVFLVVALSFPERF